MIGRIHLSLTNGLSVELANQYSTGGSPVICFNGQQIVKEFAAIIGMLQNEGLALTLEIAIDIAKLPNPGHIISKRQDVKELLSRREKEVLRMMFDGLTNKEIAQQLFISFETVKSHRKNILSKTGSKNTAALTKNLTPSVIEELKK